MHRGQTETIVNRGTRAEADAFFVSRINALSESTRLILYALVLSSPNIQETIGNQVSQSAFDNNIHGSDGANSQGTGPRYHQPAHDVLPQDQKIPVDVLEQAFNAPSVGSLFDPIQTESFTAPEQIAQPALEMTPGVAAVPVGDLEQISGMNQYDQMRVESNVAQDLPGYNASNEQSTVVAGLPGDNDGRMADEARLLIEELHNGLGYEELDKIPGGYNV